MKIELNIDDRIVGVVRFFLGKQSLIVGFVLVAAISSLITYAAVVKPHTFTSGTVIRSDHVNENFDELYQYVNTLVPVGTIVAWHKSMTGTPAIPGGWVECNGQVINDTDSPYNGQSAPSLNNNYQAYHSRGLFLRGGASSGVFEDDAFQGHWHQIIKYDDRPTAGGGYHFNVYRFDNVGGPWGEVVRSPVTDGANGTPRYGTETRPVNMSVV